MKRIGKMIAVLIFLFLAAGGTMQAEAAEKEYLHEETFSADYRLQGLLSSCSQTFQAGDWDVRQAQLHLYYTSTMLVLEEISDFTVSINGRPVYSEKISITNGEIQSVVIPIPTECIREGINQISIESYIRTNEEDPCRDDVTDAGWMMILQESQISVRYLPAVDCDSIVDIYGQLSSIEGLENKESAVVIPAGADDGELTAAALALAGISANAALSYDAMEFITAAPGDAMPDKKYILYISSLENCLPQIVSAMSEEQTEAAHKDAVMFYMKGGGGQNILVVTGENPEALENACRLLGNSALMGQMKGGSTRVSAGDDVSVRKEDKVESRLTETGSYVDGPFSQTATFYIEQAANLKVAAGSRLKLKFRYAQNLDFSRSLVTVYLGETPLGSKKLTREGANGDSLTVDIPENLMQTGSFNLNITFDLEIQDMECTLRRQDMPWAYITSESTLLLKTEEIPYLLFDYFPSPFITGGSFHQLAVILPARESAEDLGIFASLMLTLGRYLTDNTGDIRVRRADDMGDLSAVNIISIGKYKDNPIVQQQNDSLYFKFSTDGKTILSNEKMKIEQSYGATLGTAQLLYSPYSASKYGLLLITGATEQGLKQASVYFTDVTNTWRIYGDGFVTDQNDIYCFTFGEDNARRKSLSDRLASQGQVYALTLAGSCMLFLMLFAYIMLMKKYYRRNRKRKDRSEYEKKDK